MGLINGVFKPNELKDLMVAHIATEAGHRGGREVRSGRMGEFTITKDPTRTKGLRMLMGPSTVYNKDNVEAAAK